MPMMTVAMEMIKILEMVLTLAATTMMRHLQHRQAQYSPFPMAASELRSESEFDWG
ncbi:hypothetical protein F441_11225 [Phytophthora nicotianae CJ01A1]|uniref:Uncharacterized protein n=6 Tax=Phytophthora nicotianae TaxID=4792 RepID=W2Q3V3_PHYN3|nr:hypothetical protein PPTG_23206 [Phytophthora nicotianae INRA-310]ETI43910.1 hypothetical protein F443_11305 [Phytophthora nicotianae P1569]ETK83958.1 hypothetical protein L915_11016 [Phytophthora nicotianae]ETO72565.1 hypothetical protein F444_11371 [Phytophthora nicotianae P1976]ETP13734.1 hypothetical protein F441_11225 [Phytophthora nicotianae CJ01A1]ETP41775.1 hypothetical protein F442_11212 [Phytophthora nicotianae P10297]